MEARDADHFFEEVQVDARRRRIVREVEQDELGRLHRRAIEVLKTVQELSRTPDRQRHRFAFRHDHAPLMNGIAGRGRDHFVAGADDGEHQVRQCVFRADGDDRFFFRIEIDAIVSLVAFHDFEAKIRDALRQRVAMVLGRTRGFDQLGHDRARGRAVGVPHAEIYDVLLFCPQPCLHLVDGGKYIGRQLGNPVELGRNRRHKN